MFLLSKAQGWMNSLNKYPKLSVNMRGERGIYGEGGREMLWVSVPGFQERLAIGSWCFQFFSRAQWHNKRRLLQPMVNALGSGLHLHISLLQAFPFPGDSRCFFGSLGWLESDVHHSASPFGRMQMCPKGRLGGNVQGALTTSVLCLLGDQDETCETCFVFLQRVPPRV